MTPVVMPKTDVMPNCDNVADQTMKGSEEIREKKGLCIDNSLMDKLRSAESPEECVAVVREIQRLAVKVD